MPGRSTRRLRRELGLTVLWSSRQLRYPKVSKGRAESSFVRPQAHTACPRVKHDAPTPARTVGLPSRGGQYFLSTRKKVPKKARGTALREKGFYCPFCRLGSQCRAQFSWIANTNVRARSCAHLFPLSKWAGLFPFAAYRRSAPPQLALDRLNQCRLGWFAAAWIFLQCKRPAGFHIHAGLFSEP